MDIETTFIVIAYTLIHSVIFTVIYACIESIILITLEIPRYIDQFYTGRLRQQIRFYQNRIRELRRQIEYFQNQNRYVRELQNGLHELVQHGRRV